MKRIEELEQRKDPLSVKEAASIYGDSVGTFYKKIRSGEIPGVFREPGKPRGKIKIWPAEFAEFLKGRIAAGCKAAHAPAMNGNRSPAESNGAARNGPKPSGTEKARERRRCDLPIEK